VKAKVLLVIACVTELVAGVLLFVDYAPMGTPGSNPPEGKIGDVLRIAAVGSKSETAFGAAGPTKSVLSDISPARSGFEGRVPQNGHAHSSAVSGHPGNDDGGLAGGRPDARNPGGVGPGQSSESEPNEAGDVPSSTADAPTADAERNATGAEAVGGVVGGVDAAAGAAADDLGGAATGPASGAAESVNGAADAAGGVVAAAGDPAGDAGNTASAVGDGIGGGLP
jgi:hypothetical protein